MGDDRPLGPPPSAAASLAPWSAEVQRDLSRSFALRLVFFLVVVPVAFSLAVWMREWFIVVTVLVGLGIANAFDRATRLLDRFPTMLGAGLFGKGIALTLTMRDFYREQRPFWFLYYMVYPLAAPVMAIFNRRARRELKLWGKAFLVLLSCDVLGAVLTYSATYPPYLGITDALRMLWVRLVFGLILAIACLMPVMTTAFTLSLAGRGRSLRALSIASLLLSLLASGAMWYATKNTVSITSQLLLTARMKKPDFRKDVALTGEIVLTYLQVGTPAAAKDQFPVGVSPVPLATEKFRDMINRAAPNDEPKAFKVVAIRPQAGASLLYGVLYSNGNAHYLLHLEDDRGRIARSWKVLSPELQAQIRAAFAQAFFAAPENHLVEQMSDDFPTR